MRPSPLEASWFMAEIHGDLHASPRGKARFGLLEARDGRPSIFTLSLGSDGVDGSVLFTRIDGGRISPGTYAIDGRQEGSDGIWALLMTGTAARPTGVFRGHSGFLTIISATDSVIQGQFTFDATGFLASDPQDETRRMHAIGMFTATRQ